MEADLCMHVSVEYMALQPEQKSGTASKARKKERLMRTSTGLLRLNGHSTIMGEDDPSEVGFYILSIAGVEASSRPMGSL